MKIDGSYTMNAPREQVYETLSNPDALRGCLPGCERFEETGEGRWETTLKAGVAGIRGEFTGVVTLTNQNPPESYTLSVEGNFKGGFVKGVGNITLDEADGKTSVKYSGDGQVSGPLASVGQRLMAPGVKMVANQFFRCMEGQVGSQAAAGAERGA